jgi:hypothetical protein
MLYEVKVLTPSLLRLPSFFVFTNCSCKVKNMSSSSSFSSPPSSSSSACIDEQGEPVEKDEGGEGEWYTFNDSQVTRTNMENIVSPTGYVLFYQRRQLSQSNVINFSL